MAHEWNREKFARGWIQAQNTEGDLWRTSLINPVVRRMCTAVAQGKDPSDFSVFDPIVEWVKKDAPRPGPGDWKGVTVIDLGCGEGHLGAVVTEGGASYRGIDRSPFLVDHAVRNRGLSDVKHADLETIGAPALGKILGKVGPKTIITCILVLEHLKKPEELLASLGSLLSQREHDVSLLVVTLARTDAGESPFKLVPITSMAGNPPPLVRCRSRLQRAWERCFRDAGLFIRACEPVCLSPDLEQADKAHPHTFWCWRLVARHRGNPHAAWTKADDAVLARLPEPLQNKKRMRLVDVPEGTPFIRAFNLGGELTLLLRGVAFLRVSNARPAPKKMIYTPNGLAPPEGDLLFESGYVFGELEAGGHGGPAYYSHDVIAGAGGCRVAVISSDVVARELQPGDGIDGFFFQKLRHRFQLDVFRDSASADAKAENVKSDVEDHHVAPIYQRRLARLLLWAAAIERRHRSKGDIDEVVWLNLTSVARIFQPSSDDVGNLMRAVRLFQGLRLIEVLPLGILRTLKNQADFKDVKRLIIRAGEDLLVKAADVHLANTALTAAEKAHVTRELVAIKERFAGGGNDSPAPKEDLRKWLDDLEQNRRTPKAVIKPLEAFLVRLSSCWHDTGTNLCVVIRDRPSLQQLGLGPSRHAKAAIATRRLHLNVPDPNLRTSQSKGKKTGVNAAWKSLITSVHFDRKKLYVESLQRFCNADLEAGGSRTLRFSDELATR